MADFVWNLFSDVDHKASPFRFPLHWKITSDSTEVSEFRSLVFWLQLCLLNANHVHISSFKEIFQKWQFSMDAVGVPLKNAKLVLVYTRAFLIKHWGHFIILTICYRLLRTVGTLPSLCRLGSHNLGNHNLGAVGHHTVEVILGLA